MVHKVEGFPLVAVCVQQHVYVHVSMPAWLEDMRPPWRLDPLQGADLILTPACTASKAVLVEMLPTFDAAGDVGALGRIAGGDAPRLDLKGKYRPAAPGALPPQTTASRAQAGPPNCIIWLATPGGADAAAARASRAHPLPCVPAGCTYSMHTCEGASTLLLAKLPTHGEEVLYSLQSAMLHGFMPSASRMASAAWFYTLCQQDGQRFDPQHGSIVVSSLHSLVSLQALDMQAPARPTWKLSSQSSCLCRLRTMQMQVRIRFSAFFVSCCCLSAV